MAAQNPANDATKTVKVEQVGLESAFCRAYNYVMLGHEAH